LEIKKIQTQHQLDSGIQYFKNKKEDFNEKIFENLCGIGIIITKEEIKTTISKIISKKFRKNQ